MVVALVDLAVLLMAGGTALLLRSIHAVDSAARRSPEGAKATRRSGEELAGLAGALERTLSQFRV